LQARLYWRAIKLNIAIFKWERALELAVQHNTHVDTVLGHRARYLKSMSREETDARYKQLAATVMLMLITNFFTQTRAYRSHHVSSLIDCGICMHITGQSGLGSYRSKGRERKKCRSSTRYTIRK
jgi:hypothetical protein